MTLRLYLETPPSLNHLFPTAGARRIRSRAYDDWATAQKMIAAVQRPKPVLGRIAVAITISEKLVRGDLDNRIKATLDLLVDFELIQGDSKKFVRRITVEWGDPVWQRQQIGCLVEVWGYGQEQESRDQGRPG